MDMSEYGEAEGAQDWVIRLPGVPEQVQRARRLVTAALGRDHPLHDDGVLLTSELATNAVLHSQSGEGGAFTLTVTTMPDRVRIVVSDEGSATPPCACRPGLTDQGGRGLPLVDTLADRWGLSREDGANTVWFELALNLVGVAAVDAGARFTPLPR
ncbi:Anti-sigma regulatory factor (Ser/Thr protein kinase) [Sinosporangium album]|uniref:Anti-sigma regulatory factor (Ser/Thr protein kinase) n=1 Tax=Sinosporangium album TaxID=504805 RepID=A0A1G8E1P1_9ACTN|nr:ATP-binding protein [Sinosporangium album]SDH63814.1 Anti-sigma regulatory factor (Ser/Thr protein kinase) [Sinosporangium album]